jgi:flagellar hook-basal body complex protein FliE
VLQGAVTGLTDLGQAADAKSVQAMSGQGNMTDMVMAVSKAEMALDASVAVRDKVISAYQEIMRMSV